MFKKWLAFVGVLLILVSAILGMALEQYWDVVRGFTPDFVDLGIWRFVQSILPISYEQLFVVALLCLLLGVGLTVPWFRERLQRENVWWEKRDEPLDKPPRIP